ncbi:lytic transglycosylase domain-containing protein [Streptomyces sp. NPDC020403]|uniref:lytic transglycosylase domain-containing protein n=1 Tax=unclassified Streptomyces TaxID=2593676 RepID=UPI0033E0794D
MRFDGTMRRGLTGTATAVAAMAALTASQAPGLVGGAARPEKTAAAGDVVWTEVPNDDSYHTELPPLKSPEPPSRPGRKPAAAVARPWAEAGIPATVLAAYRSAQASLGRTDPGCHLPWQLLAAIGKVESGHAGGGRVDARGTTLTAILGPVLNGEGFARITDTDGGAYDGDARYDRAVGPMQFIPSTWAHWGRDGNGDGREDPGNIADAALAAGHYLCAGPRDLSVRADLDRAVLSYNHSDTYLRTVLSWLEFYRGGAHPVADGKGVVPRSPGAGGRTRPKNPVGGPGSPGGGSRTGGGGIVIGPRPGATPRPSASPTPSESGSPDPGGPATPTPAPDPTTTPAPDPTTTPAPTPTPDPTPAPDPTTTPDPTPTPDPTATPDPDSGTSAPGCPTPPAETGPAAPADTPCATPST